MGASPSVLLNAGKVLFFPTFDVAPSQPCSKYAPAASDTDSSRLVYSALCTASHCKGSQWSFSAMRLQPEEKDAPAASTTGSSRFAYNMLAEEDEAVKAPGVARGKDGHIALGSSDFFSDPLGGGSSKAEGGTGGKRWATVFSRLALCLRHRWQQWWQCAFVVAGGTDEHIALASSSFSSATVRGMEAMVLSVVYMGEVGLCSRVSQVQWARTTGS